MRAQLNYENRVAGGDASRVSNVPRCSGDVNAVIGQLRDLLGHRHVLTGARRTRRYSTGYRFGSGTVVGVLRPGSLVQLWKALQVCVEAGLVIIMQAANTGLTGGSTPDGDDYDHEVVIVSTTRLSGLYLLDGGRQVVCLPGVTLYDLERALKPIGREPHSVIGSSCLGASVFGGIANNSGGALIRRGPAFTELALYAQVDAEGTLKLVNHLGIELGRSPSEILSRLEKGDFEAADVIHDPDRAASDHDYERHVRDIDAVTPARFNADPRRLREASGNAGRLAVFAVRLDTFPKDAVTSVFYIGSNDVDELSAVRRRMLRDFSVLPVSAEYMHETAYDIAERYGKDTFLAIRHLGTDRLPMLFSLKARLDAFAARTGAARPGLSDRVLQRLAERLPPHLPKRMQAFRTRYAHHLIVKMADDGIVEARDLLASMFPSRTGDVFECTAKEAEGAFLHRFAAAGAAVRYRAVHADVVEDIVALDIALPRNASEWFETLPPALDASILHKLYYGHFFCHVFHQDYIIARGADPLSIEHAMWDLLDERRAEYPAEHNVGHLYQAKAGLSAFYRALDPCNQMNPGIGQTSKHRHWR